MPRVRAPSIVLCCGLLGCHEPPSSPASVVEPERPAAAAPASADPAVASPQLDGCASSVAELPASTLYDPADPRLRASTLLVAHKSARRLMLFRHGVADRCVAMGLGFDPQGHKQREGDGRTPEGWYRTSDKPWSDFPGAIAIHYPNHEDAAVAREDGRLASVEYTDVVEALDLDLVPPQQTAMGGEVLIHGGGSQQDWTLGCMALSDDDLAGLRDALPEDKRVSLLVLP